MTESSDLERSLAALKQQLETQTVRVQKLEHEWAALRVQIADLTETRKGAGAPLPKVKLESLVSSLRALLEAQQAPNPSTSGVSSALRSIDVEAKAFVEPQSDGVSLILPTPDADIEPNALSVLKLSFVTVPSPRVRE